MSVQLPDTLFCELDGYRIAYHRQGQGETLILLHGITTYSFIWHDMLPYFSKNYDVIALDLLGNGESDKPADMSYSIRSQADVLLAFMQKMKIPSCHLVCHDVGGGVGQIFTVHNESMVKNLVLINTAAYDYWPVQPIITMRTPILRQFAMAALDKRSLKMIVQRGCFYKEKVTDAWLEAFWSPLNTKEGRKAFLRFAKSLNNQHLMSISNQLRALKTPLLLIRAEQDRYLSSEIMTRLHAEIPASKYMSVSSAGHFIQIDRPDFLAESIIEFLETH